MATLTTAQIALVRLRTGDKCPSPEVTDEEMQILYDDIPNMTCGCSNSIDTLIALVFDARVAKGIPLFDEDGDGGSRSVSQKFDHLVQERDRWFAKCGMDVKPVTISSFSMGLDADCEGSEYASRPYPYGYAWWGML